MDFVFEINKQINLSLTSLFILRVIMTIDGHQVALLTKSLVVPLFFSRFANLVFGLVAVLEVDCAFLVFVDKDLVDALPRRNVTDLKIYLPRVRGGPIISHEEVRHIAALGVMILSEKKASGRSEPVDMLGALASVDFVSTSAEF